MSFKYQIQILGCQANEADSQRIKALLDSLDFVQIEDSLKADLIIIVACSVRQNAIDFVYRQSAQWHKRRQKNQLKTILTGCVLDADREKLESDFDWITTITSLPTWPEKLETWFNFKNSSARPITCDYLDLPARQDSPYSALIPIMNGCNNFCSYCAVPYTRGRETSRPSPQIISEITTLLQNGYREITLLGQNVNSYRDPENNLDFPELLRQIQALPYDFWLRFMTSHPKDFSPKLLSAIADCDKICEHLHLAVQSGSDEILKAMNRHYTAAHFEKLAADFRQTISQNRSDSHQISSLTTDVIVGFPGETAADFEKTLNLFKKVKFDLAYIGRYSPRPGTAAEKMPDNVSAAEKTHRDQILNQVLKQTALENNQKYLEKIIEVLVIKKHKKTQLLTRARTAKNVLIPYTPDLLGQIVKVKITQVDAWGLFGELV